MTLRFSGPLCAIAFSLMMVVEAQSSQTLRFDTNVGTFDMILNPTGNPFLQNHVDNILAYVEDGSYENTVINRAATNFVLQMGGFQAHTLSLPNAFSEFPSVRSKGTVTVDQNGDGQVDFDLGGLSNTRGTVSLALQTNAPNSGNSSFFINLSDSNDFLDDSAFVPFAEIADMQTVDLIMSLSQANLDPSGQNLAAINIPITENNHLVIIERVFVLNPMAAVSASNISSSTSGDTTADVFGTDEASSNGLTVPEPASLMTALGALLLLATGRRRPLV